MQSSKNYRTNPRRHLSRCLLLLQVVSGEHYLGLADPEKESRAVADSVHDLASVVRSSESPHLRLYAKASSDRPLAVLPAFAFARTFPPQPLTILLG